MCQIKKSKGVAGDYNTSFTLPFQLSNFAQKEKKGAEIILLHLQFLKFASINFHILSLNFSLCLAW